MTNPRVPTIQSVRLNGEQWAAALARWQSTAIAIAAMLTASTTLTGCGPNEDEGCAAAYERAALKVAAVVSAEFTCGGSLGNSSDRGTVTLAADTQEDATPAIEDVYRSFAADPTLTHRSIPFADFVSESDSGRFYNDDLGFDSSYPSIDEMRENYGITPTPTP